MTSSILYFDRYIFIFGFFLILLGSTLYTEIDRLSDENDISVFSTMATVFFALEIIWSIYNGFQLFQFWWILYLGLEVLLVAVIWDFIRRKHLNSRWASLSAAIVGANALMWVRAGL